MFEPGDSVVLFDQPAREQAIVHQDDVIISPPEGAYLLRKLGPLIFYFDVDLQWLSEESNTISIYNGTSALGQLLVDTDVTVNLL